MCIYIYICVYTYANRQRERGGEKERESVRERERQTEKERAQYGMLKMHGQCMSICIYVGLYHLYKCIHAVCNYVYTYIYTYTYTNIIIIHRYTFIYIYTTLYVYIYIHTYMFIYMFIMNTSPYYPEEVKLLGCNSQTKQSQAKPSQAILKGNFLNRCVI